MVVARPVGGVDYPRTWGEFVSWFSDEAACVAYLERLRWGDGFECPSCGSRRSWRASRGLGSRVCAQCAKRTSVTAGTVFAGTRTPLTQWFAAAWHVCSTKNGASALGLQKLLGFGSYETAWAWLHKLRRAMVIPGRDLLTGDVEVDETFVGGDEPGLRGGRARASKKALVAVGCGVSRLRVWSGAPGADPRCRPGHAPRVHHRQRRTRVDDPQRRLAVLSRHRTGRLSTQGRIDPRLQRDRLGAAPAVHRVASLLKRWLDGTHQGAVSREQLDYYLDEFTFRFNRRDSTCPRTAVLPPDAPSGPHRAPPLEHDRRRQADPPAMPVTTRKRQRKM